jgi:hypothetical protein
MAAIRWARALLRSPVTATFKTMKYSPARSATGRPLLTLRETSFGLWGFAVVFAIFGLKNWQTPPSKPFSGRLAWLYTFADSHWGQAGPALVIFAGAMMLFVLGILVWHRAAAQSTLDLRPTECNDV